MNITEIATGQRVLVQSSRSTIEVAYVKQIKKDGRLVVGIFDKRTIVIAPQFVIKILQ